MSTSADERHLRPWWRNLHRNIWATSLTSFFMDISSEMVINILPLYLSNVLGVKTHIIGLIEGIAEATASLLKVFSGWLSDKLRQRKWLAVAGYSISTLAKPFFYVAHSWPVIAAVRWADRVGKGIRTAPRDALVADSVSEDQRGFAFGFHRAADTGGAMLGTLIALFVVWLSQTADLGLSGTTFRTVVLVSLIPAVLAVLSLALGARHETASCAKVCLPQPRQAVHGLCSHRRPVRPGQLIGCVSDPARTGTWSERVGHTGHACYVQPGLWCTVRTRWIPFGPHRAT